MILHINLFSKWKIIAKNNNTTILSIHLLLSSIPPICLILNHITKLSTQTLSPKPLIPILFSPTSHRRYNFSSASHPLLGLTNLCLEWLMMAGFSIRHLEFYGGEWRLGMDCRWFCTRLFWICRLNTLKAGLGMMYRWEIK